MKQFDYLRGLWTQSPTSFGSQPEIVESGFESHKTRPLATGQKYEYTGVPKLNKREYQEISLGVSTKDLANSSMKV